MSDNPFREEPSENPYAPPAYEAPSSLGSATNPLLIPGIFLLVLAAGFLLLQIGSLPGQILRLSKIDTSTPAGVSEITGGISALVGMAVITFAIILGSVCMLRLKGYSGAMTAAILAVIPICSPCFVLGIPFGIWAIVLLRKPEVKRLFS